MKILFFAMLPPHSVQLTDHIISDLGVYVEVIPQSLALVCHQWKRNGNGD